MHTYAAKIAARDMQRGFTLLEILIALFIGLFMLGALLVIVQSNRSAFLDQNKLARLQDNERIALTVMTEIVQSTGYFPNPLVNTATSALSAAAPFAVTQAISGTHDATTGDTLSVRYMTTDQDGILNCSGLANTSGAQQVYVNQFSVSSGQLLCTMNGTQYPLVNGISRLDVLYGVNTSGSGNNVDTYLDASQMSAANWNNVISVLVKLTFSNPLYVAGQSVQPQSLMIQRVIGTMNQSGPMI